MLRAFPGMLREDGHKILCEEGPDYAIYTLEGEK